MKEMKLSRFALSNYQFTLMVFILLMTYGVNAYFQMPRTEDPEIVVPGGSVIAVYPGASPVDMEELVASPLEDAINEIDDIKKINTSLRDGIAVISVEFEFNTDADKKYDELLQKVNSSKSDLPDNVLSLEIMKWTTSDVNIMQIALVSEDAAFAYMEEEAEKLKKEINKIKGIKRVEIIAVPEQEIRVSLDLEKMAAQNISVDQVARAIQSNNANIPGGNIKIGDRSFGIKTSGSYKDLDEIRNTVVHGYAERLIYLKNIADISFDYEDNNYYARFNGERSIFLAIQQKSDLNLFDITGQIRPIVENFRDRLADDMEVYFVFDQSEQVQDRINGFLSNLFQGILLVGAVILLALGFRSAIIVIIAIPLSIVMGLGAVDVSGFGLQQITIAGLVVSLGLLVDNSIVIVENINRFVQMGHSPKDAAIKGTSQIGYAIISSTATTVLAFVPLLMMPDKAGAFIKSLPVTIIGTLIFSLMIALSLSPLIAGLLFKKKKNNVPGKERGIKKLLKGFIEGPYRISLAFALRNKILTVAFALLVLGFSVFVFIEYLGTSFFPKAEKPQFMIRVNTPEGSSLDKTDRIASYVESVIDTMPDVKYYATNVGHGNPRIYYNIWPKDNASNFAEIFVQLKSYDVVRFYAILDNLRSTFSGYPGAKIVIKEFEQGTPIQAPVMVYIHGKHLQTLRKISEEIKDLVESQAGSVNVENELSKRKTDLHFNINREKAAMYGVPVASIDRTIRASINGETVSSFRDEQGEEYNIVLRLPEGDSIRPDDFEKIWVQSISGSFIPLDQLATIEFRGAPGLITRYNLDRTALITADVRKGFTLNEVMDPVIEALEEYNFPAGYGYHIGGELESREESFGGMQVAILVALISIFAVLVLQFRSFVQPLIIYSAIPFALIGMIWALLITGNTFSFTAFVGLISLVGIVINNSIILVDYTNQLRNDGNSITEALKKSGETRFTPIILTTLTTIGGLLPLTIQGGSLWAPMGWTIIGGLLVSTLLTLIIVPVLYKIFTAKFKA